MSKNYTQHDWAMDHLAVAVWDEDEFLSGIDRKASKRANRERVSKLNKKNHRRYA